MKKAVWSFAAVLALCALVLGCGSTGGAKASMTPGTYTAEARGYVNMVKVATEVSASKIVSVKVVSHSETNGIGSFAVSYMPDRIVSGQSIAADIVTGASVTSGAILAAVTDGLKQAGANVADFAKAPPKPKAQNQTLTVDVVVVGAGGAGLAAGIEARNKGKNTLIIEKMDVPGGNTVRSSGDFNVAGAPEQIAAQKGRFSIDNFIKFTMDGGHNVNDRSLVEIMVKNSYSVVEWLTAQGLDPKIREAYGSYGVTGEAKGLILNLLKRYEALGGKITYAVKATEIIMKNGQAAGVTASDKNGGKITINAKSVVLASGGFGGDLAKCVELDPKLAGFVTDNSPSATGDGIWMAQAAGAGVVDLNLIQSHPTIDQVSSTMLTEEIRVTGGILLNTAGKRFTDEVTYRDVVSAAILTQDQKKACILYNKEIMDRNGNVQGYLKQGLVKEYKTLDEVAAYIGVNADVVKQTVATWSGYVKNKSDPEFGSHFTWLRDLNNGPWYALWIAPGIHHTMGGVKINTNTEVISTAGAKIPGLFAAGEVTGGVHGGNRVGGNAILDILFFGRTAGANAAAFAN